MEQKVQIWHEDIWMQNVSREVAREIAESFNARGIYNDFKEGCGHFTYWDRKPAFKMTPEELKAIKRKVQCRHCNRKQFFKNEVKCRYCLNYNEQWVNGGN